jgi:hypothetical protein
MQQVRGLCGYHGAGELYPHIQLVVVLEASPHALPSSVMYVSGGIMVELMQTFSFSLFSLGIALT